MINRGEGENRSLAGSHRANRQWLSRASSGTCHKFNDLAGENLRCEDKRGIRWGRGRGAWEKGNFSRRSERHRSEKPSPVEEIFKKEDRGSRCDGERARRGVPSRLGGRFGRERRTQSHPPLNQKNSER